MNINIKAVGRHSKMEDRKVKAFTCTLPPEG